MSEAFFIARRKIIVLIFNYLENNLKKVAY